MWLLELDTISFWPNQCDSTQSISWLLLPRRQHPWHWRCRIGEFLSYLRKDFNYIYHFNVEEGQRMKINIKQKFVCLPSKNLACKSLNMCNFISSIVSAVGLAPLHGSVIRHLLGEWKQSWLFSAIEGLKLSIKASNIQRPIDLLYVCYLHYRIYSFLIIVASSSNAASETVHISVFVHRTIPYISVSWPSYMVYIVRIWVHFVCEITAPHNSYLYVCERHFVFRELFLWLYLLPCA